MRIYADTSVFGGLFDLEFAHASQALFEEFASGRFVLVTSALVEAEIEPAPDTVREAFYHHTAVAEIVSVNRRCSAASIGVLGCWGGHGKVYG